MSWKLKIAIGIEILFLIPIIVAFLDWYVWLWTDYTITNINWHLGRCFSLIVCVALASLIMRPIIEDLEDDEDV